MRPVRVKGGARKRSMLSNNNLEQLPGSIILRTVLTITFTAIVCVAMINPAQASGEYRACNPAYYNADACLKAHNQAAREKNKSLDLMDLADHAIAAGDKVAAFGHWSLAARSDKDPIAMYRLGAAFYNGDGAPQSYEEAAKWFRQSADLNYAAAQYMLGALYDNGQSLDQSTTEAIKWYQKAADQELPEALYSLGYVYFSGEGAPQDDARAAELWGRGAKAGHVSSQTNYGFMLSEGRGVDKDYQKAEYWTRKGVEAGNATAKSNLGEMYEYGRGVPVDLKLAVKWYSEAAAAGINDAKNGLARIAAMDGAASGAPAFSALESANKALQGGDLDGGIRILTTAAENGDFEAQVSLGKMHAGHPLGLLLLDYAQAGYWMEKAVAQKNKAISARLDQTLITIGTQIRDGAIAPPDIASLFDGVQPDTDDAKDYAEAVKWYELAAKLGNSEALIAIGDLYGLGGHGLDQKYTTALQYYKRANKADPTPISAHRIGVFYSKGQGVDRDDTIAAKWLKKSAREYPEAELWLAQHQINQSNLRSAGYWLDRLYLRGEGRQTRGSAEDNVLHQYYDALLPPAPAGWTEQPIEHLTTKEPVKRASLASDEVLYPIIFQRRYQHDATGIAVILRVLVNYLEKAEFSLTQVSEARQINQNILRELKNKNPQFFKEALKAASQVYVTFGRYEGYSTTLGAEGEKEALIEIPLNSHILVRAETVGGDPNNPEHVEMLKTILRVSDFGLIKNAAETHGHYKKDSNGIIYKP